MYYGLTFSSGGESLQVVMNTSGLRFYARASNGGAFGPWKLVCGGDGEDGGSGEGSDSGTTVARADVANKAYKLASPITISFRGDVTGDVTFDGSTNVVANLSGGGGGGDVAEDKVREVCRQVIADELGTGKYPLKLIEKAIFDAIDAHFERFHK